MSLLEKLRSLLSPKSNSEATCDLCPHLKGLLALRGTWWFHHPSQVGEGGSVSYKSAAKAKVAEFFEFYQFRRTPFGFEEQ